MKTKPILIITAIVLVVAASCFAFFKYRSQNKPGKSEIIQFLNAFNKHIQAGNIDSAKTFFEDQQKSKAVKILLSVLTNKTNTGGKEKPIFKVSLNTEDALIKFTNPEFATARITAVFKNDYLPGEKSTLVFTIHKRDGKQYKITQVDATGFVKDYGLYQARVYNKITPEKDIYSAMTLAAFKTAEKLKARYDSVAWFEHVDNKTFYYVVKGKLPDNFYYPADKKTDGGDYKIGLVNPELNEIIPAEYDLIHNIGGTIDGLIEVEKGNKKGFYNLNGKVVVPINYDQIYPLKGDANLAVLKNGDDFFYLKANSTLSDKITDFKISDIISHIKKFNDSYTLTEKSSKNVMEYNSKGINTSLIITPSYMAGLGILPKFMDFPNPLRKLIDGDEGEDGSISIAVKFDGEKRGDDSNWFQSAYYTIADDYLGGRGGLYASKSLLLIDKKHNQILGFKTSVSAGDSDAGTLRGACLENSLKAINDSLFEFKTTSVLDQPLFNQDENIREGPMYYFIQIKNNKLVELKSQRIFPTQYINLDESYLQGCYTLNKNWSDDETTTIDHVNKSMLQYMKNEIYASYKYRFKSQRWNDVFEYRFSNNGDTTKNANVDDSLTVIDKYNISFINSKLNGKPLNVKNPNSLAAR